MKKLSLLLVACGLSLMAATSAVAQSAPAPPPPTNCAWEDAVCFAYAGYDRGAQAAATHDAAWRNQEAQVANANAEYYHNQLMVNGWSQEANNYVNYWNYYLDGLATL